MAIDSPLDWQQASIVNEYTIVKGPTRNKNVSTALWNARQITLTDDGIPIVKSKGRLMFNLEKAISDTKPAAKQAAKKQTAPKNTGHVWFSPIRSILIDAAQQIAGLKYQTDAAGALIDLGFVELIKKNKAEDEVVISALAAQAKTLKARFSEYPETIKLLDAFMAGIKEQVNAVKPKAQKAKPKPKAQKGTQEVPAREEEITKV